MQAGMGEQETEPSAVMGLLRSENIRAQNEGLFPETSVTHLTLEYHHLPGCSHQNKHKKMQNPASTYSLEAASANGRASDAFSR